MAPSAPDEDEILGEYLFNQDVRKKRKMNGPVEEDKHCFTGTPYSAIDERLARERILEKKVAETEKALKDTNQDVREALEELRATTKSLEEQNAAHAETQRKLELAEVRLGLLTANKYAPSSVCENLLGRVKSLETRVANTEDASETHRASMQFLPSADDLQELWNRVPDAIVELKKELALQDQERNTMLEERFVANKNGTRKLRSDMNRTCLKRSDLWTFSRAVDEGIQDAIKKTLRRAGAASMARNLAFVPTSDFYGTELDKVQEAEGSAKKR